MAKAEWRSSALILASTDARTDVSMAVLIDQTP